MTRHYVDKEEVMQKLLGHYSPSKYVDKAEGDILIPISAIQKAMATSTTLVVPEPEV